MRSFLPWICFPNGSPGPCMQLGKFVVPLKPQLESAVLSLPVLPLPSEGQREPGLPLLPGLQLPGDLAVTAKAHGRLLFRWCFHPSTTSPLQCLISFPARPLQETGMVLEPALRKARHALPGVRREGGAVQAGEGRGVLGARGASLAEEGPRSLHCTQLPAHWWYL